MLIIVRKDVRVVVLLVAMVVGKDVLMTALLLAKDIVVQ